METKVSWYVVEKGEEQVGNAASRNTFDVQDRGVERHMGWGDGKWKKRRKRLRATGNIP